MTLKVQKKALLRLGSAIAGMATVLSGWAAPNLGIYNPSNPFLIESVRRMDDDVPTQRSNNPLLPTPVVKRPQTPSQIDVFDQGFLENKGQWDSRALLRGKSAGLTYWITRTGVVLDAHKFVGDGDNLRRVGQVVDMVVEGTSTARKSLQLGSKLAAPHIDFVNFTQHAKSAQGVAVYSEAVVKNIVNGVDMRSYVDSGTPRYDITFRAGIDPSSIRLRFDGAFGVSADEKGLKITTNVGDLYQTGLFAYQMVGGAKVQVPANFEVGSDRRVKLKVGKFDRTKPLVVDPLVYGTYVGGNDGADTVSAITSDNSGNVFIGGITLSDDFPITAGPYGVNLKNSQDGFVMSLTGDAYNVTYVAYLGGAYQDSISQMKLDQYGDLWVAGITSSPGFHWTDLGSYGVSPLNTAPTAGTFIFQFGAQKSAPLPFNVTAAALKTELNKFTGVTGGFNTSGGPLPANQIAISYAQPQPLEMPPLQIVQKVNPYIMEKDPNVTGGWALHWVAPAPPDYGYRPTGGTFDIQIFPSGATTPSKIARNIAFDATSAAVVSAIKAQLSAGQTVTGSATGGNLPIGTYNLVFGGGAEQNTYVVDGTNLTDGLYSSNGAAPFAVRFQANASTVLDPLTNEVIHAFGSQYTTVQSVFGLTIRPQPSASGPIDLTIAGTVAPLPAPNAANTPIPEITSTPVPAGTTFGYIINSSVNHGTGAFTTNSARSRYIGAALPVSVTGMTADASGALYVTGTVTATQNYALSSTSPQFKTFGATWPNANLLRMSDAFVQKYDANGAIVYSGVIGGSNDDSSSSIAVDNLGNVYITGVAGSPNFPRTTGAFGQIFPGSSLVFVTKINSTGSALTYSTNLATRGVVVPNSIAVDARGNAYVGGRCIYVPPPFGIGSGLITPTPVAPLLSNQETAIQGAPLGLDDGFLSVLNASGTGLLYSSYIGGAANDGVNAVYVDANNSVYVGGDTTWVNGTTPIFDGLGAGNITTLAFKSVPDFLPEDGFVQKYRVGIPTLAGLTIAPTTVPGGHGSTSVGTVTLKAAAPVGGTQVTVRVLNPSVARLSAGGATSVKVTVPAGFIGAQFLIYTNVVTTPSTCDIRAEYDGDFLVSRLSVVPWLQSVTTSTDSITGGSSFDATINLVQAAPSGGLTVALAGAPDGILLFDTPTVTIPEGQTSAQITVQTNGVATSTNVNLNVSLDGVTVSTPITVNPATVLGISFSPTAVNGGESSTCTVTLDGKAAQGVTLNLTSAGYPATLPSSVALNAGDVSTTFTVTPNPLTNSGSTGFTTVTAQIAGQANSVTGALQVDPDQATSLVLSSHSILGGLQITGTVNIAKPASGNGFNVKITTSNTALGTVTPQILTILPGSQTATFTLQTFSTSTVQNLVVSASKVGYPTVSDTVTLQPVSYTFNVTPLDLTGGTPAAGSITLASGIVAPIGGLTFSLTSSNPSAASMPATVTIPANGSSVSFNVTTQAVGADTTVNLSSSYGASSAQTKVMTVRARIPQISSITFNPTTVLGGTNSVMTITLDQAAGPNGVSIGLAADKPSFLTNLPSSLFIPAGSRSVSFTLGTTAVTRLVGVVVTGTVQASGTTAQGTIYIDRNTG